MKYFWTNTIWFILLGITTLIEIVYFMLKATKRKRTFALYLTVAGMTYAFEMTIFVFLKSYDYYPMIFHQISRIDDGLAGNIFSQFSVSATALLISVLNLKYYWYLGFAFIYAGIEELFLYLGIYKHNWYRTWMTVVVLMILFCVTKILYEKALHRNPGRILKYILVFFAVYVPHTILLTWPIKLLGYPAFNDQILSDPVTSMMLLFTININVLAHSIMIAYFLRLKWWGHSIVVLYLYLAYYIAYLFNYIIYKNIGSLILFATVEIFGMYLFVFIMDRLFDQA